MLSNLFNTRSRSSMFEKFVALPLSEYSLSNIILSFFSWKNPVSCIQSRRKSFPLFNNLLDSNTLVASPPPNHPLLNTSRLSYHITAQQYRQKYPSKSPRDILLHVQLPLHMLF